MSEITFAVTLETDEGFWNPGDPESNTVWLQRLILQRGIDSINPGLEIRVKEVDQIHGPTE